jgi:hypothetical protein
MFRFVIRKATIVVGAATLCAGVWIVAGMHHLNNVCTTNAAAASGAGASVNCVKASSSYLIGLSMTIGGFLILMLTVVALARRSRRVHWQADLPEIPKRMTHQIGSLVP